MARPLWIEYPGTVHHVLNRGLARKFVFHEPTDYEIFLQVRSDTHARWSIEVVREAGFNLIPFQNFMELNQGLHLYKYINK